MGNLLVLCINGDIKTRETIIKNSKILQIMKNDGKILEFRNPIFVRDLLSNYRNCYVGMFKEATQPLPFDYKLKMGKIYYLFPSNFDHQAIIDHGCTSSSTSVVHVDSSRKSTRIKVVITKEELKKLLLSQDQGGVEKLVLGSSVDVPNKSGCSSSTWMPKLESIPEGSDVVC